MKFFLGIEFGVGEYPDNRIASARAVIQIRFGVAAMPYLLLYHIYQDGFVVAGINNIQSAQAAGLTLADVHYRHAKI